MKYRQAASAHPDGVAARERDDTAFDRAAMGVSLSTVNRAHMTYDHGGIKALKPRPSGTQAREHDIGGGKGLAARFAKAAGAAKC